MNAFVALIGKDVIYFGAGRARGFDTIAAETVLELKTDYPLIKLILVLPYHDQTRDWEEEYIRKYSFIKKKTYNVVFTSEHFLMGVYMSVTGIW